MSYLSDVLVIELGIVFIMLCAALATMWKNPTLTKNVVRDALRELQKWCLWWGLRGNKATLDQGDGRGATKRTFENRL